MASRPVRHCKGDLPDRGRILSGMFYRMRVKVAPVMPTRIPPASPTSRSWTGMSPYRCHIQHGKSSSEFRRSCGQVFNTATHTAVVIEVSLEAPPEFHHGVGSCGIETPGRHELEMRTMDLPCWMWPRYGGHPVTIAKWARRQGSASASSVDLDPHTINMARKRSDPYPKITSSGGRVDLPLPKKSFDLRTLQQTVHHFTDEQVLQMINEVSRVARGECIVDITAELDRLHSDFPADQAVQQEPPDQERRTAIRAEVIHPRRTCRACLKEPEVSFPGCQQSLSGSSSS